MTSTLLPLTEPRLGQASKDSVILAGTVRSPDERPVTFEVLPE